MINWYTELAKPALTPPAWVFPPAWCFLYITIFISLLLFTTTRTFKIKGYGYTYFVMQMIFNLLWSPVFFILHNLQLSAVIIIILDILVLLNIVEFYKISKLAGLFLVPYFLWIIFATYLNIGIALLN